MSAKSKPRTGKRESVQEHGRRHGILRVAEALMLARGYAATTVDQICAAAEVTKGAFFHHFPSKEAMAEELLERYIEKSLAPLAFGLDPNVEKDPLKRLHKLLRGLARGGGSSGGCLIGMFALELSGESEKFRSLCDAALCKFRVSVQRELAAAMRYHDTDAASRGRAKALASLLVAGIQGGNVLERAAGRAIYLKKILSEFRAIIDQAVLG